MQKKNRKNACQYCTCMRGSSVSWGWVAHRAAFERPCSQPRSLSLCPSTNPSWQMTTSAFIVFKFTMKVNPGKARAWKLNPLKYIKGESRHVSQAVLVLVPPPTGGTGRGKEEKEHNSTPSTHLPTLELRPPGIGLALNCFDSSSSSRLRCGLRSGERHHQQKS